MTHATEEQQAIIEDTSRIRVVQAVPGSGKTWLVAEIIRRELLAWDKHSAGIAALSFTNVGGDEIRRATGYELARPHFVGTIDAFLFRFVLRPFVRKVWPQMAEPKLIPAEWKPNLWEKSARGALFTVNLGQGKNTRTQNVLEVHIIEEKDGRPVFGYKPSKWGAMEVADPAVGNKFLEAKKKLWVKHGFLTHSDAAFLSSQLLRSNAADFIASEIAGRFPLLVVDELQDTGWCLGKCITELATRSKIRSVLVGDPDQAIYEFSGATPALFQQYETLCDAKAFRLSKTRRCGPIVCRIAQILSATGTDILPADTKKTRALLLSYRDLKSDIPRLLQSFGHNSGELLIKAVARQHATLRKIRGCSTSDLGSTGSKPTNFLHNASVKMHQGQIQAALLAVQSTLTRQLFDCEFMDEYDLDAQSIDPIKWRQSCIRILLEVARQVEGDTVGAWADRAEQFIVKETTPLLTDTGINPDKLKFRKMNRKYRDLLRADYLPNSVNCKIPHNVRLDTVHGVKGETHDLTILVSPSTSSTSCPSAAWWPEDLSKLEEQRITYVAVTRTRGDLMVCVSEKTLDGLREKKPEFVECFEVSTIESYIADDEADF